jgi:hypothetical protein
LSALRSFGVSSGFFLPSFWVVRSFAMAIAPYRLPEGQCKHALRLTPTAPRRFARRSSHWNDYARSSAFDAVLSHAVAQNVELRKVEAKSGNVYPRMRRTSELIPKT